MPQILVCIGLRGGEIALHKMEKRDSKGRFVKGTIYKYSFKKGHPKSNTGRTHFKKGMTPWIKGKKGIHQSPKTEFKKGNIPLNKFKKGHIPWNKKYNSSEKLNRRRLLEKYDKKFNNNFKREIRKRDNQICMLCKIHREKLNKALDIHHVNYDKFLSIPQNCISLCHSCHPKTNHNRKYWETFFQSLLSENYGYKYEKNKIVLKILGGKDCGAP